MKTVSDFKALYSSFTEEVERIVKTGSSNLSAKATNTHNVGGHSFTDFVSAYQKELNDHVNDENAHGLTAEQLDAPSTAEVDSRLATIIPANVLPVSIFDTGDANTGYVTVQSVADGKATLVVKEKVMLMSGGVATIPEQTVIVDAVSDEPYHVYVALKDGGYVYKVEREKRNESHTRIYLGSLPTTITDQNSIATLFVGQIVRVDLYRFSTEPKGSSIPVASRNPSTGVFELNGAWLKMATMMDNRLLIDDDNIARYGTMLLPKGRYIITAVGPGGSAIRHEFANNPLSSETPFITPGADADLLIGYISFDKDTTVQTTFWKNLEPFVDWRTLAASVVTVSDVQLGYTLMQAVNEDGSVTDIPVLNADGSVNQSSLKVWNYGAARRPTISGTRIQSLCAGVPSNALPSAIVDATESKLSMQDEYNTYAYRQTYYEKVLKAAPADQDFLLQSDKPSTTGHNNKYSTSVKCTDGTTRILKIMPAAAGIQSAQYTGDKHFGGMIDGNYVCGRGYGSMSNYYGYSSSGCIYLKRLS